MTTNIPKIIHYCWFGKTQKPRKIQRCINTWKKILNDYQFLEWNEENFDINYNQYVAQAYKLKKYAFVSDVCRIIALQKYGGIYLDTDVQVIKKFDDLLDETCVLGFEEQHNIATSFMAAEANHSIFNEFIEMYNDISFIKENGEMDLTPNVKKLGRILEKRNLKINGEFQILSDGTKIYPKEYFSAYDYINCINEKTKNTYCVHLFLVTWMPIKVKVKKLLKRVIVITIGKRKLEKLRMRLND